MSGQASRLHCQRCNSDAFQLQGARVALRRTLARLDNRPHSPKLMAQAVALKAKFEAAKAMQAAHQATHEQEDKP